MLLQFFASAVAQRLSDWKPTGRWYLCVVFLAYSSCLAPLQDPIPFLVPVSGITLLSTLHTDRTAGVWCLDMRIFPERRVREEPLCYPTFLLILGDPCLLKQRRSCGAWMLT